MSAPVRTARAGTRPLPGRARIGKARPVRCQVCAAETQPGLDLGHQPVGDLVLAPGDLNEPETAYPLQLHHCYECGLTQLGYTVNPRIVYKNFPFVSGTTATATRHLQSLPPRLVKMLGLGEHSFALDIGSNDGTLLKAYRRFGVPFLGVDPSGDPVRIANEAGIPTLHAFFNTDTAESILSAHGQADAITACGVFAHMADLDGVMKGVQRLLAAGGVFATDSQYWFDMVQRGHYDNIFHQHLRYYAMRPLIRLFANYGMDVFDVERSDVYGGSVRVYSCHAGDFAKSRRVARLVADESRAELYEPSTNERFARTVQERRDRLFDAVYRLRKDGRRVIGIGAPAKASTVSNYCRLSSDLLDYITEVNPLRVGMFLPGVHVPIVEEDRMFADDPPVDAGVLFAWNYYDEIVPKLRERGYTGDILTP
ncbi:MAG: methyltransferase domain-containing protein [Acidimicrobiia bacterium]